MSGVQSFDDASGVADAIEEIRTHWKQRCAGRRRRLVGGCRRGRVLRDDSELALVHRNDRTVAAEMFAAAGSFRVSGYAVCSTFRQDDVSVFVEQVGRPERRREFRNVRRGIFVPGSSGCWYASPEARPSANCARSASGLGVRELRKIRRRANAIRSAERRDHRRRDAPRDLVCGSWEAIAKRGASRCAWAGKKRSIRLRVLPALRSIGVKGPTLGQNVRVCEAKRWGKQGQTAGGPIRRLLRGEFSRQGQYSAVRNVAKTKRDSSLRLPAAGRLGMTMSERSDDVHFRCPSLCPSWCERARCCEVGYHSGFGSEERIATWPSPLQILLERATN